MTSARSTSIRPLALTAVLLLGAVLTACLASGQSADGLLEDPRGHASYYADKFAGQTTASGETFDPDDMTAAHPSLPFDTVVRVTRVGSGRGRAVTVRINDRGPFADDRIIDLSEAAAQEIGMIEEGVVEVRIEILELPDGSTVTSDTQSGDKGTSGGW
jgi:rare lipoprotein A